MRFSVVFSLLVFLFGCNQGISLSDGEKAWLNDHGNTIRIARFDGAPPLVFVDGQGRAAGLAVDYHRIIADMMGFSIQEVAVPNWQGGVNLLKKGRIDVITMQHSPERAEFFTFTSPYIRLPYVIVTRKENRLEIGRLAGKKMAVEEGFLFADYIRHNHPQIQIVEAAGNPEALRMVDEKEADACGINLAYASYLIEHHRLNDLTIADQTGFINKLSFAASKENAPLKDIIQKGLSRLTAQDHNRLHKRWIGLRVGAPDRRTGPLLVIGLVTLLTLFCFAFRKKIFAGLRPHRNAWLSLLAIVLVAAAAIVFDHAYSVRPVTLTPEEKAWLKANRDNITTGKCLDAPPVAFTNSRGEHVGMDADIIGLLEQHIGFRAKRVCVGSWPDQLRRLEAGAITFAVVENGSECTGKLAFTDPVYKIPRVLITRSSFTGDLDPAALAGRTVMVSQGGILAEFLKKTHPQIHVKEVPDTKNGLLQVSFGQGDIFCGDLAEIVGQIESLGISNLRIAGDIGFDHTPGLATRADNRIFRNILQKGIESISGKEMHGIYQRWIGVKKAPFDTKYLFAGIAIFSTAVLILLLTGIWNYFLRRTVQRQTAVIRDREERLDVAMAMAKDGMWDWDMVTNDAYFDHRCFTMAGYEPDAFPGRFEEWSQRVHPEDFDQACEAIRANASGASDGYEAEYRFLRKDGSWMWIRGKGGVVARDSTGKPVRMAGTHSDITEGKEAEREKLELERHMQQTLKLESLGVLAGGIAHDFNNILAAIIGYAELVALDPAQIGKNQAYNRQILAASERARELVQQILAFSRQSKVEKKPVDMGRVIKEVLKLLRASIPATIEIVQNVQTDVGVVSADPTQIHQIVMNLCTNAFQAMGKDGGRLDVGLAPVTIGQGDLSFSQDIRPGPYLKLVVTDTGHGMDENTASRIFEPYFTTKASGEGTGMGLATVHGIVKSHGGEIKVSSRPGKGTEFQVLFPLIESRIEESAADASSLPGGKEQVLFVDDEESLVDIGKKSLESLGYAVEAVTSPVAALAVFQRRPAGFDVVVTDMTMPEMTGMHLAENMKAIRPDIPIIVCTGYSNKAIVKDGSDKGIDEILEKPLTLHRLANTVRAVLDKHP